MLSLPAVDGFLIFDVSFSMYIGCIQMQDSFHMDLLLAQLLITRLSVKHGVPLAGAEHWCFMDFVWFWKIFHGLVLPATTRDTAQD